MLSDIIFVFILIWVAADVSIFHEHFIGISEQGI
jgi:hypothetical protein